MGFAAPLADAGAGFTGSLARALAGGAFGAGLAAGDFEVLTDVVVEAAAGAAGAFRGRPLPREGSFTELLSLIA
ncbi:MAG TPA: hypothetical protein PKB04_13260, partial [Phenylobacterium sp.]|nr:hypothetical protein [Phenylobacterium sp.]